MQQMIGSSLCEEFLSGYVVIVMEVTSLGAIMEFATEKQIESFLSTCHIEGQKNFLMVFKKKDMAEILY